MAVRLIGVAERVRTKTPPILRNLPVWLLWRYEHHNKKVPYYADGVRRVGGLDRPEDRARLVSFDAAEEAFDARPGYYTGFAVALGRTGDRVLSGIDLDDCREETKLTASASQVVEAAGSYAEVSPGNCGVKIFGWGDIGTEGSRGSGVEIYSGRRFFTVTGRSIAARELADLNQAADLARSLYLPGVPEGARNNTLFTYACGLRDSGVSFPDALSRVRDYNLRFNQPPLAEAEVMSTTKSAFSRPPREGVSVRDSYLVGPEKARPTLKELTGPPYEPPMVVAGLLPQDAGGFVAPGGTGKSTLILFMCVHIILGRSLFGRKIRQQGPVLYLTAEDDRELVMSRVNQICRALKLSNGDLKRIQRNFYVEDLASAGARLARVEHGSIVVATGLADEVVEKYRGIGLALATLDPTSLLGPGESSGNDGMAELMRIARGLAKRLLACVLLVHHVAQIVARGGIQDQYAGRGGTAFADNSRFNCQVVSPTTREVEHRGSTYLLPADVTDAELAEGSVLALLLHKLSYEKNTAQPIVLVRKGYEFRQVAVTRLDNTPEGRAARDRDLLDKLVAFIEKKLGAGRKFTKNSLANECTDELGMARDKIRSLVETALEQGRLELAPLPAHERHGSRKEYLRPVNLESA